MKCIFALRAAFGALSFSLTLALCHSAIADEPKEASPPAARQLTAQEASAKEVDPGLDVAGAKEPEGFRRLLPNGRVWLDTKGKRVVMVGEVCLRDGQLEMFACLKGTKEHEAIVAVPTKAFIVHAALIALGADPGSPASFAPEYTPAKGPRVDVTLFWTDAKGKRHQCAAQDWITNSKTGKPMSEYWVFGGSGFYEADETSPPRYRAEDGDFICISNFTSAMLDLPIESSQSAEALVYKAATAEIPPIDSKVCLVLTPRVEKKEAVKGTASTGAKANLKGTAEVKK